MSKNHYERETTNYSNSEHQNTFVENDFLVHLTKPNYSVRNIINDDQVQPDDEENFTDLRSCAEPNDTESDSSRSNSPLVVESEQLKSSSDSSCPTQNHMKSNEDDNIPKKNIFRQLISTSCSFEPYRLKSFDDVLYLIQKDPFKFIVSPVAKQNNNYMQCRLVRTKSGFTQIFHLEVELENNGRPVCLLTAEKEIKMIGQSSYLISLNPKFRENLCLAELVCDNLTGTSYTLYVLNEDQRQELAVILYETNFLGFNGPRKLEVLLPKLNHQMKASAEENDISKYCSEEQNDSFIRLQNKTPIWNQQTNSYILRFDGKNRVTIPSIRNFQMVIKNKEQVQQTVMQFGRMSEDVFSCDFQHPLSFIQAFGIGLSALETRLFRE